MNEAARRLLVSPPAVSAAVGVLEEELGVPLVERAGRGLVVTPAGEVFARYARQCSPCSRRAGRPTAEALDPERGQVRLAAVTTAGKHVVPRFLASFRARHPEAGVSLEVGNGIVSGTPWSTGRPTSPSAAVPSAVALRHPGHPTERPGAGGGGPWDAGGVDVDIETIARSVVLVREDGSGTRGTAEELLDEMGVSPRTLTLGSNGAIRESVQVGLGITLISRHAVVRELDEGALVEWRCADLPPQRAWHVVARAHEHLPLFLAHLAGGDGGGFALVREPAPS